MVDYSASKALLQSLKVDDWKYETTQQKKDRIRFEAIHDGLFYSRPGKQAQGFADLSTRFPEHYLITSLKKPPPVDPESLLPHLPPALKRIRKLQRPNGSWVPSPALYEALGGNIPDPPPGVSRWRWATALTVVFIRRHPELHSALNDLYEKAREWTSDPHLMKTASAALPPAFTEKSCYFPLNEAAMKKRRWQDAAVALVEEVGYRMFVPEEHRYTTLYPGAVEEKEWFERQAARIRTEPFDAGEEEEDDDELRPTDEVAPGTRRRRRRPKGDGVDETPRSGESSLPPVDAQSEVTVEEEDPDLVAARQFLAEVKEQKKANASFLNSLPLKVKRRRRRHKKGLGFEWHEVGKRKERRFHMGEKVCCLWRRGKRWEQPVKQRMPAPAIVTRVNHNGTVDVAFQDPPYERENSVARQYVKRVGEDGYVDFFRLLQVHRPRTSEKKLQEVRASGMSQEEADTITARTRARRLWKPTRSQRLKERWFAEIPELEEESRKLQEWHDQVYARPDFAVRNELSTADRAFRARPDSIFTGRPTAAELQRRREALPGYKPPEVLTDVEKTLRRVETAPGGLGGDMRLHDDDGAVSPARPQSRDSAVAGAKTTGRRGRTAGGVASRLDNVAMVAPEPWHKKSGRHLPSLPVTPEPPPPGKELRDRSVTAPLPGSRRGKRFGPLSPPGVASRRRPSPWKRAAGGSPVGFSPTPGEGEGGEGKGGEGEGGEGEGGEGEGEGGKGEHGVADDAAAPSPAAMVAPGPPPLSADGKPPPQTPKPRTAAQLPHTPQQGARVAGRWRQHAPSPVHTPVPRSAVGLPTVAEVGGESDGEGDDDDIRVGDDATMHPSGPELDVEKASGEGTETSGSAATAGAGTAASAAGAGAGAGAGAEAGAGGDGTGVGGGAAADGEDEEDDFPGKDEDEGADGDVDEETESLMKLDEKARRRALRLRKDRRTDRIRYRQRRRRRRDRAARYKATNRVLGDDSSSGGYSSSSTDYSETDPSSDENGNKVEKPKINYSAMSHEELIKLIHERQINSKHRPPSHSSDGISSDEMEVDIEQDYPANRRQRLHDRVTRCITLHERLVKELLVATLSGSVKWRTAVTKQQKQAAFRETTRLLRKIRGVNLRLCESVREWGKFEMEEFGTARGLVSQRPKHGEAAKPADPVLGRPWPRTDKLPPPFYWHGRDAMVKLVTSLDFLDGVPELREWYTDGFPMKRNPFAMPLPVDERPPTPRKKTRKVLMGKSEVEKEFKSLVAGHNMDLAAAVAYRRKAKKNRAPWWPCTNVRSKEKERIREAERDILVAEFAAREMASAVLHGSTAIRRKAVPHAMDGLNPDGTPIRPPEEVAAEKKTKQRGPAGESKKR